MIDIENPLYPWQPHLISLCMSQIQNHFGIYLISYLIMSCIKHVSHQFMVGREDALTGN